MRDEEESGGIGLLDFLFTVAISLGMTPEVLQIPALTGLLSETWVQNQSPPTPEQVFQLATFLLGTAMIAFSWFGYHGSIKQHPIKYETVLGMMRFSLDIVLIIIYGLTLILYKSFPTVATLITAVFVIYAVWDVVKVVEHHQQYGIPSHPDIPALRRELVSWIWATAAVVLWLRVPFTSEWGLLAGYAGCLFLFRVHKHHPLICRPLDCACRYWGREPPVLFRLPDRPMRIYIAGPYTADTEGNVLRNVNTAIDAGIAVYRKGHYPYIPHLTHFIEQRSQETGAGLKWEDYLAFDREWLGRCDGFLYLASSKGADLELKWARELRLRVFTSIDTIPSLDASHRDFSFVEEHICLEGNLQP
ncbi:MAG TPA: DUF4406 domain-containing protein [Chloroflexota bacterium]|nr:DUF4406 domain-containing protein [Chloroflexota bacterium]